MNFWKHLRLLGSVLVLVISVIAVLVALLRQPDTDENSLSTRSPAATKPLAGPTGL